MKATAKLLAALVAVGGLGLAMEAEADRGRGHGARGHGGHWNHGHRHWGHGHRHRHWHGGWGLWLGAPLVFGAAYGWPYYYGPRETLVYREREVFPEGTIEPTPRSTEIPQGEGAPSQGPLYMNYCESAKAYFPKVTTCPEGWKLATPTN